MEGHPPDSNPYVGPRPFRAEEQALFFGREQEAGALLALVMAHPAVLLYAQSGAGKTSLLNARLIPALKDEGFEVLPVARVGDVQPAGLDPQQPGNRYVFNTLLNWLAPGEDARELVGVSLAKDLRARPRLLDEAGDPCLRVILFDQFEELFSLYPERWAEREDLLRQVAEALAADRLLRVVFSMREEYLAQLDPYLRLLPESLRARFRLERLRAEAALEAVNGPLARTGRRFAPAVAEELVQELRLIRTTDASGRLVEAPGEFVEPVQLQVVCSRIWANLAPGVTEINLEHLHRFGDVRQALADFYEGAVRLASKGSGVSQDRVRRWCGGALITALGTRSTVLREPQTSGGLPNAAVDVLEGEHLIRAEERAGARWYELTHDRFIEPVRESNRAWEARRKQKEMTRLRGWMVAMAAAVLVLSGIGWYLVQRATQSAVTAQQAASTRAVVYARVPFARDLATQSISMQKSDLGLALLLANEAVRAEPLGESLASLLSALQASPLSPAPIGAPLAGHKNSVSSVAFSPDGKTLASGSRDNTIILWDVSNPRAPAPAGAIGAPLVGHKGPVLTVAFSPDGKTLASGSLDATVILWDVSNPRAPATIGAPLAGHKDAVWSVAFSPDGKTLASGSGDRAVILWDVSNSRAPAPIGAPLVGHKDAVSSVAFSPDGKTLASGSDDKTVVLRDVSNPRASASFGAPLAGHKNSVTSVAFSPDGKTLASGSRDSTIILWDFSNSRAPAPIGAPLVGHKDVVWSVAFSPDGKTLASGSYDKTVILWDVSNPRAPAPAGAIGAPLAGHKNSVSSVAFSPDGKTLASGSRDNTIILWDVSNPRAPAPIGAPLADHEYAVSSVAFSPDGKTLASGNDDWAVILRDVSNPRAPAPAGAIGAPLVGHKGPVLTVAFSPDGKTLASGSYDNTVILWDLRSNPRAPAPIGAPLAGHKDAVWSVAFSPDGKTLASGSRDNTIILWDVSNPRASAPAGAIGAPLVGHKGPVWSVAFSPDGKTLASGSGDSTVILWDVSNLRALAPTGANVAPLVGHKGPVLTVAFSPDGKTLASGSGDSTVILWDIDPASWQALACRVANRNLTQREWQQYLGAYYGADAYHKTCEGLPDGG